MDKLMQPASAGSDGLEPAARRWATFSILLGTFLGNLDASIANVALPAIAHDLSSQAAQAVWVVNAYQLAMAVAVLPLASVGERFGYRRVFIGGLVVFTIASLLCALAGSVEALVAARVLQGLGGACVSTIVPALLRSVYPAKLVGRGIGLLALTVAASAALGPTVAAGILSVSGWRALFAVNLPLGLFAIVMALRILPANTRLPRPFDRIGAVLSALTIALFIIGVGNLGDAQGKAQAVAEIILACITGIALFRHQRGRVAPLVPLDLMRIPVLRLSVATSIFSYVAQTIAFLALPFLLVSQLGRSVATTGLLLTPWPLVIVFIAPLSGRLSDRYAAGTIGAAGLSLLCIGLLTLVGLPPAPSDLDMAWRVALCGIGFGLFQTPNNRLMLMSAPRDRSAAAGGLMTMARLIGMTLGAALATVMFDLQGTRGAATALMIAAASAAIGIVFALLRLRPTPA